MDMHGQDLQLWLALLTQTTVVVIASIKYILRIERRLMAIELVLKAKIKDNGKTGEISL